MAKVMSDVENMTLDDFLELPQERKERLQEEAQEAVTNEETEEAAASPEPPVSEDLPEQTEEVEQPEQLEEPQQPATPIFEVTDLPSAVEAQRRAVYHQERIDEIDAIVAAEIEIFEKKIEKIVAWGDEAKAEYVDRQSRYVEMLEGYLKSEIREQQDKGKKKIKKTIKLPYGSISMKKQAPKFIRDDEKLMDFALEHDFVKIADPAVDWSALKKKAEVIGGVMVYEDGEIIPGVEVVEQVDKFEIKWEGSK